MHTPRALDACGAVRRALSAAAVLLSACGSSGSETTRASPLTDDAITVGSFDFAESVVVAEVYSQGLEAPATTCSGRSASVPREFVGPALATGLVEFIPEYAGTAADFYSLGDSESTSDVPSCTLGSSERSVGTRWSRWMHLRLRTATHSS